MYISIQPFSVADIVVRVESEFISFSKAYPSSSQNSIKFIRVVSKTIDKIPTPDIAISMGCDVGCPYIGRAFDDDWGLPDPTGKSDECFIQVIEEIARKIKCLNEGA